MISIPDNLLQGATLIMLALYVGAFLNQAVCVLHVSHVESPMASSMDSSAAHASSSMATHASPSAAVGAPSSMTVLHLSQNGEHSGAPDPDHTGVCAAVSCASALTATTYHDLEPMNRVSPAHVAYLGERIPPDAEMVPPPPRLG